MVGPGSDDFARTRLTHSLEVAQVGRELGGALGCDPDVVDTACLSHDLGHPPFGHNGEAALAQVAAGIGGFEGNAQTLRLLTRLEPKTRSPTGRARARRRPRGLNLTRASLDATTKYPWRSGEDPRGSDPQVRRLRRRRRGGDEDVFAWLREGAPDRRRCIEAQVMDLADDVAYCVHDVEDAVVAGRLDLRRSPRAASAEPIAAAVRALHLPDASDVEVDAALDRLLATRTWVDAFDGSWAGLAALKDMTSQLIGRFCAAAERATREVAGPGPLTRYSADLVVPRGTEVEIAVLKGVAAAYVLSQRDEAGTYAAEREVVTDLVRALQERPHVMEPPFAAWHAEADDDAGRLRAVVDQVASLTDTSALAWHARLVMTYP